MPNGVAGIAERIRQVEIAGIPLGEAALGGGSALFVSEFTDGLVAPHLPQVPVAAIKGAEAYAVHRWGYHAIGAGGARVASLFLTYDALRSLVPLDDWIKSVVESITGVAGGGSASTSSSPEATTVVRPSNGQNQDSMDQLRARVAAGGGQ